MFNWQEVKCLLVVAIGELEGIQPALQRIRATLEDAEIVLLVQILRDRDLGRNEDIQPLLTWVNRIINYTSNWQDGAKEKELVEKLRHLLFDAAIIFTTTESPHPLAYLCYLAEIPIRVGQSREFGGGVLSHWIKPPLDDLPSINSHLYLLDAAGLTNPPLVPISKH